MIFETGPDVPEAAVTAAAIAIHERRCNCAIPHRDNWPGYGNLDYDYARAALAAAAAPHIAAHAAADAWARDHGCRSIAFCCKTPREAFQAGREAAAPHIAAQAAAAEREAIAAVISPAELRTLALWFDADDALKVTQFPTLDQPPGNEVQTALRKLADLLDGGNDD